jgi:hypothetical protein
MTLLTPTTHPPPTKHLLRTLHPLPQQNLLLVSPHGQVIVGRAECFDFRRAGLTVNQRGLQPPFQILHQCRCRCGRCRCRYRITVKTTTITTNATLDDRGRGLGLERRNLIVSLSNTLPQGFKLRLKSVHPGSRICILRLPLRTHLSKCCHHRIRN